jgi:hypothetical protein
MTRHLRRRLLERAAEIVGDRDRLRSLLVVDRHALELWLSGRATLPQRAFEIAMEIVLQDDIARAAQDRRGAPRLPEPMDAAV